MPKVVGAPRGRRKKTKKPQSRKSQKSILTDQVQSYEIFAALANASFAMNLEPLFQGDAVQARKDFQHLFSGNGSTNVTVVADIKGLKQGRKVLETVLVKVYVIGARTLPDSSAISNVLFWG